MEEILHKKKKRWGKYEGTIREILGKIWKEIYCSTVKDKLSEIDNLSKNLLLGLIFNPWLCVFSPRTSFKPRLTNKNPVNSPVLSSTLFQIYCIRLIGPISYFFWVWAAICDPTIFIYQFFFKYIFHHVICSQMIEYYITLYFCIM